MSQSYRTTPSSGTPADTYYLDAQIDCRSWSTDELLTAVEVEALDAEDDHPTWPGETGRHIAGERLRAYEEELDRRTRIFSMPESKAKRYAANHEEWAALAREVREHVDCAEVLLLIGFPPRQVGRELHGPCPACRDGDDRLLVRQQIAWCRVCGARLDAIAIVRSFMPGLSGFRDAVRFLADLATLEVRS